MRLGLIALGDSITNGDGEPALGVPCRSWALWLAQALELPYTNLAWDGAMIADVLADQLPRVRGSTTSPAFSSESTMYAVGSGTSSGTPRISTSSWSAAGYASRVLVLKVPLTLDDRGGAREGKGDERVVAACRRTRAVCASLDVLHGARMLPPDAVHPTALGQLEIADRAALALGDVREDALDAPARKRRPQRAHAVRGARGG